MKAQPVYCPYCNREAEIINNMDLYGQSYGSGLSFICENCDARTGCSKDGNPLGTMANKELRQARRRAMAHIRSLLDNCDTDFMKNIVYAKFAKYLGISRQVCSIGRFNLELCRRTMDFDPERFNI